MKRSASILVCVVVLAAGSVAHADLTVMYAPYTSRPNYVVRWVNEALVSPAAPPRVNLVSVRIRRGHSERELELSSTGDHDPEMLAQFSEMAMPAAASEPVRTIDARVVAMLAESARHFDGAVIEIVSGYRPNARASSRHRHAAAIDFRLLGVDLNVARDFFDHFDNTGLGIYPTSNFLHLDVRERTTRWVDYSGSDEANAVQLFERGQAIPEQAIAVVEAIEESLEAQ